MDASLSAAIPADATVDASDTASNFTTPPVHYPSLNFLRGVAILAALLVSIWWFGGFSANKQTGLISHPSGGNYRLFATISLLFEGKMRALIGLVFGAGLWLYMAKREAENKETAPDFYMRRQMWLIAFGLVNGIWLLWPYDMLFQLGIVGIFAFPFLRVKPKGLLVAAMVCLLIFCGKNYWQYADNKDIYRKYLAVKKVGDKIKKDTTERRRADSLHKLIPGISAANIKAFSDSLKKVGKKDTLNKEQADDKAAWEGLVKGMTYDPKKDEGEKKNMRETSYGKLFATLLGQTQGREAAWTYRIGVWELGMSILLGIALLKLGFFEHRYRPNQYLLFALTGISIGLLLGWYRLYFHNATLLGYEKYITTKWFPPNQFVPIERLSMAFGYAALGLFILSKNILSGLTNAIADVGKLALTNYLLQSIFLGWFFTGFGSGNFGKLNQWQLYLLVAEVVLVQIAFSVFWLKVYAIGPAEWLWQSAVAKRSASIKKPVQV